MSVCGTVTLQLLRGFSWQRGIDHFVSRSPRHRISEKASRIYQRSLRTYLNLSALAGTNRRLICPSASPHRSLSLHGGTGMLTRFPSATPFGLALGPTDPERIDLAQETLGLRRTWFSHVLSLLVPAGSLPYPPPVLVGRASSSMERSSTNCQRRISDKSVASVAVLSPVELSAQIHLTSELLRFL